MARGICCCPANNRFLTGLSAQFGMTKSTLLKLVHYLYLGATPKNANWHYNFPRESRACDNRRHRLESS